MSQDLIIAGESGVEAYVEALTRAGRRVVAGRFTLDEAKARAKLSSYQLVTPHHYVLELVQAAHLLGATYITARAGGGWFELRFDGAALTQQELGQLWGAAFAAYHDDRERACRHLAIGVQAALGLKPRQINISCDDGRERVIFSVESDTPATVRVEPSRRPGTMVQVRKALNLDVIHQSATAIEGRLPEFMLLRYRCALSEIPILINGQRVSAGWRHKEEHDDGCFVRVPIETEWERGWLGIRASRWPSVVSVMQHGVLVMEHAMPLGPLSVRAVVTSRRLSKNLSQSAFVQDEAWHTFMDEVILEAWHEALWRHLEPQLSGEVEAPRQLWIELARQVFSHVAQLRQRARQIKGATRRLALAIEHLKLWRAGDRVGEEEPSWRPVFVSLAQLGVGLTRERPLAVTRALFQDVAYDEARHAMLASGPDVMLLEGYLGQAAVDVTERLELMSLRQRNELAWRRQPPFDGVLDEAVYPSQLGRALASGGFVMVAVVARGLSTSTLEVYKQRRRLLTRQLPRSPLPRLLIIWSADPEPNERFDEVSDSEDYIEAMLSAVAMVPALVELYVSKEDYPDERLWRGLLDGLCEGTWWRGLLGALGVECSSERLLSWRTRHLDDGVCGWALSERAMSSVVMRSPSSSSPLEALAGCGQLARMPYLALLGRTRQASLWEVFELYGRLGFIPWVLRAHESAAQRLWRALADEAIDHEVLVLDERQRQRLASLVPGGALRAYEAELERMVNRQRFMRLRPRQLELTPQDGALIAKRRLHDGLRGELGLCDVILDEGGVWASGGWLDVVVLVSGRQLVRRRVLVGFGCFVAVVEASALSPTLGWDAIVEDEGWRVVERALLEAARALIISKVIAVERQEQTVSARQVELLWSFIVASQAYGAKLWAQDELLGERLGRAKLFTVVGQQGACSYEQVLALSHDQDQLGFVYQRDAWRVEAPGWLVVPDALEGAQPLLAQLFWQKRRVFSWGQGVEDKVQLAQALHAYLERPYVEWTHHANPEALCVVEEGPDARGRVFYAALFAEEDPRKVGLSLSLVWTSREAARRHLRRRWWRVEVMIESQGLLDWSTSSALDGEEVQELVEHAQRLESSVIARWVEEAAQDVEGAQVWSAPLWRALWRARFTSPGRASERQQDAALLSAAWFKTNHGPRRLDELEAIDPLAMMRFAWPEDEGEVKAAPSKLPIVILPARGLLRELTTLFELRSWAAWGDSHGGHDVSGRPSDEVGFIKEQGVSALGSLDEQVSLGMLAELINHLTQVTDEPVLVQTITWAPGAEGALMGFIDGHVTLNAAHETLIRLRQSLNVQGELDSAWCWALGSVIYTTCLRRDEEDRAVRALKFLERFMDYILALERR